MRVGRILTTQHDRSGAGAVRRLENQSHNAAQQALKVQSMLLHPTATSATAFLRRALAILTTQGRHVRSYPFVIQACKALQRREGEAVVYNKAMLGHMIKDYSW